MPTDIEIEQEIQDKRLTAPRVSLGNLHSKIHDVEVIKHISKSGQILRWGILTLENGFVVTGKPSVAVSPENDNPELGQKIAIQNAENEVWAFEGYLLKQQLFEGEQNAN